MRNFAIPTNPATRKELCLGLSGACVVFGVSMAAGGLGDDFFVRHADRALAALVSVSVILAPFLVVGVFALFVKLAMDHPRAAWAVLATVAAAMALNAVFGWLRFLGFAPTEAMTAIGSPMAGGGFLMAAVGIVAAVWCRASSGSRAYAAAVVATVLLVGPGFVAGFPILGGKPAFSQAAQAIAPVAASATG